jgi:hypothetical protein
MHPLEIFLALGRNDVPYVLVGGIAATVHGATFATFDVDICFQRKRAACERLAAALAELSARVFPERGTDVPLTPELLLDHRMVHVTTPAGRLDLFTSIPGLGSYDDIVTESTRTVVEGVVVPVLTLDQLIRAKSALSDPKDRQHLSQLLELKRLRERS